MSHHTRMMKYRRILCEKVENVFNNAKRFLWSSDDINFVINELRESNEWKQIPQIQRNYVESRIDYFRERMRPDGIIVYAYWIQGEFVPINTRKYEKLAPKYVYGKTPECPGAYVYVDDTEKVFFGYRAETNLQINRGAK